MGRTRAELRKSMSHREFMQWLAFNSISPIGDERCHDLGPALNRQMMVQLQAGKSAQRYPLDDFLPFRPRYEPENDLDAALVAWARSQGASS